MERMVQDGFSILRPAADAVQIFRERLNISRIVVIPHAEILLRLILNLSAQPDKGTTSVNNTIERDIVPE